MDIINIGIIGGAGYTGGELLRLLLRHPNAQISFVHSTSNSGKFVHEVHPDLLGETELRFVGNTVSEIIGDADVLFLCVGHGDAVKFMAANDIPSDVRVIDLSQDFRYIQSEQWLYGLPELNRNTIKQAAAVQINIANPGCFATCIQLGLLPLAAHHLLPTDVHTSAITGSTGAGRGLSDTSHFSWRNNNVGIYKAFTHQHLKEIRASLAQLQPDFTSNLNFIPYRGSFTRGILAASYVKTDLSEAEAQGLYRTYYATHPFVHLSAINPDVKQVVNTNKCVVYVEKHDDTLLVVTAIDNLLKGASGQAVQNMNLLFGFEETTGLLLKSVAF